MLDVGTEAPEFELPNQNDDPVRLSDFEGTTVVLYFYPMAGTPGCSNEAVGFRELWEEFQEEHVSVIGVSTDPVDDLSDFVDEYDLPFHLLSDESGAVADAYDSYGTTEVQGTSYDIAFRNTYVIDGSGTIERVYEDVSPEDHARTVLDDIRS